MKHDNIKQQHQPYVQYIIEPLAQDALQLPKYDQNVGKLSVNVWCTVWRDLHDEQMNEMTLNYSPKAPCKCANMSKMS